VRGQRGWVALAVTLTLLASALGMAQPLLVKRVIDTAGAGIAWTLIGLLIALFAAQAVAHGRVVAVGSHDELLDANDYYRSIAAGWLAAHSQPAS